MNDTTYFSYYETNEDRIEMLKRQAGKQQQTKILGDYTIEWYDNKECHLWKCFNKSDLSRYIKYVARFQIDVNDLTLERIEKLVCLM